MPVVEIGGRSYTLLVGSDIIRDGMYVEVIEEDTNAGVAELFCPFERQEMQLTLWREYVPFELIEAAAALAREKQLIGR